MGSHSVSCTFKLEFQPAMKKTSDRLQEIVAAELDIEPIDITSMEVNHDIPKRSEDGFIRVLLEDGTTTITGTYERPARY